MMNEEQNRENWLGFEETSVSNIESSSDEAQPTGIEPTTSTINKREEIENIEYVEIESEQQPVRTNESKRLLRSKVINRSSFPY